LAALAIFDVAFRFFLLASGGRVHKNYGVAFDVPLPRWFVITVSVLVIVWMARLAYKTAHRQRLAFVSIIFGAAANLFDRLINGFTTDYLFLPFGAVINVADILIILGVVVYFWQKHPQNSVDKNVNS
jgi:signal peptidase II